MLLLDREMALFEAQWQIILFTAFKSKKKTSLNTIIKSNVRKIWGYLIKNCPHSNSSEKDTKPELEFREIRSLLICSPGFNRDFQTKIFLNLKRSIIEIVHTYLPLRC